MPPVLAHLRFPGWGRPVRGLPGRDTVTAQLRPVCQDMYVTLMAHINPHPQADYRANLCRGYAATPWI